MTTKNDKKVKSNKPKALNQIDSLIITYFKNIYKQYKKADKKIIEVNDLKQPITDEAGNTVFQGAIGRRYVITIYDIE